MPTKKKKPTLKGSSAVNRGFATTSIARKVVPDAEADLLAAGESAVSSDADDSASSTPGVGGSGTPTPNNNKLSSSDSASAAPGTQPQPQVTGRYGFSEADAEQQDLQNLVERHMDKVEKDIARFWKIIEFDRRFAASLPTFELERGTRDHILQLASFYTRAKLDAQARKARNPQQQIQAQVKEEDEVPDELFPALPKLSAGAAAFTPRPAQKLSAAAAEFVPPGPVEVPDWDALEAPPLKEAYEPFDKVLPKALITRALLCRLGFREEHAQLALHKAPA